MSRWLRPGSKGWLVVCTVEVWILDSMKYTGYEVDGIVLGCFDLIGLKKAGIDSLMLIPTKLEQVRIREGSLDFAANTSIKLIERARQCLHLYNRIRVGLRLLNSFAIKTKIYIR